ncbi:MAG: hypothetical protein WBV94_22500 [Blastocatellia bacterium]
MSDKWLEQTKAASHIRDLLHPRKLELPSRKMTLPDNQEWIVFQHKQRQIGIDIASGVWVRESDQDNWKCLAMPCTVSGALQAVEFLTQE